jgi:enterochelin esterase-like enzyme
MCLGAIIAFKSNRGWVFSFGWVLIGVGSLIWLTGHYDCRDDQQQGQYERFHGAESLTQTLHFKGLTNEQMETTTYGGLVSQADTHMLQIKSFERLLQHGRLLPLT